MHLTPKDVFQAVKNLKPQIMRFPGGCFADTYNWQDGIGDRDKRPTKQNSHWKGIEENNFGTDEFIHFCRDLGCESLICINFGSGTPEDAAEWVEYCNGDGDTKNGSKRIKNGLKESFNVRFWEVGNETYADWEIGHCSAKEYVSRYLEFYKKIKEKDNNIKIIACGGDGNSLSQDWNKILHYPLHCP